MSSATPQELLSQLNSYIPKKVGNVVGTLATVNISTAQTLTRPTTSHNCLMLCAPAAYNITLDGTNPTSSIGFTMGAATTYIIDAPENATIKAISLSGSALTLTYQWLSIT